MTDNTVKHSTLNTEQPLNVFLNNQVTFDVYNDKINLISGGVIETCNVIVKYGTAGYEWTSNALPYVFDQNEFSNIGNNVILKSLPYSKFDEKESTSISEIVNIVEPSVTSGETVFSSNISGTTDYKYLAFIYVLDYPTLDADATNLKAWYKFDDDFNDSSGNGNHLTTVTGTPTLSTTEFKIGKSSFYNNSGLKTNGFTFHNKAFSIACWVYQKGEGYIVNQHKVFVVNQSLNTYFSGSSYRIGFYAGATISAESYSGDINNWVHLVFQIDTNKNREIWRNGVKIANNTAATFLDVDNNDVTIGYREDSLNFDGYMDDLRFYDKALTEAEITQLYNIQSTSTSYTVNFPTEGTECSALIIGNLKYTLIDPIPLFGTYNISVGSNSSITDSNNNAITYTSETSNLSISNSITGASIIYTSNQPKVIIKYKTTKGTNDLYQIKTPGILKYTTSTTSTPSNTGSWTIEESANTTFKSDFLNRLTAPSPSTSITQVNGNNYTTDFLFDPDTKFTDKADWGKHYKYNLCLSVESTDPSDKQKYCVAFVFFNNKSGTPVFQHKIISSNLNADWTISDFTHSTTNKKYVKITVKTVNTINTLNIKI